jgi:hypothetical protein
MLTTKETIIGILIFADATKRNLARTRITTYLNRQLIVTPGVIALIDEDNHKYGAGPALICRVEFANRADADEVWADTDARSFSIVLDGSYLSQITERDDPIIGFNEIDWIHTRHWPAQPGDS